MCEECTHLLCRMCLWEHEGEYIQLVFTEGSSSDEKLSCWDVLKMPILLLHADKYHWVYDIMLKCFKNEGMNERDRCFSCCTFCYNLEDTVWQHILILLIQDRNLNMNVCVLISKLIVRVVEQMSRLWTESWWVALRSICWTSELSTKNSTSTLCTLPSRWGTISLKI